ncbi:MAG: membrane protein [Hyphomonadaceae bacterium BRH_c29]|nr:MAG: membrane protein [Hyphomonadaceae bacterium BRH_c29]
MTAAAASPAFLKAASTNLPGVVLCFVIAGAATFLAEHYGAPVMLFALLLGMALSFLGTEQTAAAGVQLTSRTVLRIGVALLGVRITLGDAVALGWQPLVLVLVAVVATILVSIGLARLMGFNPLFGLLSGGATAICGASAALALAAALPAHPGKERATLFTVIGVSILSTVAMIIYPMIARSLDLSDIQAGIFLGGTIHDVAQVVGAGLSMSPEVGDTATLVKLIRVAFLLPVIVVASFIAKTSAGPQAGKRPPLLPWFALLFIVFMTIRSLGWIPDLILETAQEVSRWCLVASMAAIGMKTQFSELAAVGPKPAVLMLLETTFLAVLVLSALTWLL